MQSIDLLLMVTKNFCFLPEVPTVYFPIMIDKVSGEPSTFETIRTLDVPGWKQLIAAGVTGELELSKFVETIAYKVVIVTGYEST